MRLGRIRPIIPAGQYLSPWQQYALAIVDTAFADNRPVYWSSSGNAAASLGLDPYLIRQGLAFKLHNGYLPEDAPQGVAALPADSPLLPGTGRWLDVPRTETLVNEVFVHRSNIPNWDHWPDPAAAGIPSYYGWAYYALGLAAWGRGDEQARARFWARADAWMELAS